MYNGMKIIDAHVHNSPQLDPRRLAQIRAHGHGHGLRQRRGAQPVHIGDAAGARAEKFLPRPLLRFHRA